MLLRKFSTTNFRGFNKTIEFNFSEVSGYTFNDHLIKDTVIKNAIVFGKNGSGKTNICLGLADIVSVLSVNNYASLITDKPQYKCLSGEINKTIDFSYEFQFENDIVTYRYSKIDFQTLTSEELLLNNQSIIKCNFFPNRDAEIVISHKDYSIFDYGNVGFVGNRSSFIKYIINSGFAGQFPLLIELKEFVDGILWFRSLRANEYVGYKTGVDSLDDVIISNNEFPMFEDFLKSNDLDLKLSIKTIGGKKRIFVDYNKQSCLLTDVWSSGTQALTLIFSWLVLCKKKKPSLMIIDEFDAYYHFKVAESIYRMLAKYDFQVILTSHNTYLMKNSITRPDCVYLINNTTIKTLPNCIEDNKEIREAHNLEKIYRNGGFCE